MEAQLTEWRAEPRQLLTKRPRGGGKSWCVVLVSPEGDTYAKASEAAKALGCDPHRSRFFRSGTETQSTPRKLLFDDVADSVSVPTVSPYGLLEELYPTDPWKCLISCILLNQTTRAQVDHILCGFLERYPTPATAADADPAVLEALLKPLGIHRRRATTLRSFSAAYATLEADPDWNPGCWVTRGKTEQQRATAAISLPLPPDIIAAKARHIAALPGIGEYAVAAFRLVCCGDSFSSRAPKDHALAWVHNFRRTIQGQS